MKYSKFVFTVAICMTIIFAQDSKFSALGFYELTYDNDNEDISNKFEFNRVYFTYEKKMSETLSYKFVTDVGRQKDDKRLEVYLKNAKIDWKTEYGKFVIGLQGTNLFKVQEKTWGYRSIEKSSMDKNKFGSSAVMGLGYFNKFDNINYSLIVSNGVGYKKPEDDSNKKLIARAFYGQEKLNSKDGINVGVSASYEPYDITDNSTGNVTVASLFGGYAKDQLRVGAEFDVENDSESDNSTTIASAYGNIEVNELVDFFARFDNISHGDFSNNYVIGGVAIKPEKGLKIMPNVRYSKDKNVDANVKYNLNFEFSIK